ncbi:MAG TPA: bifunctional riboflavin kinase/FAD synthetase [Niabella sp.]
MQIHRNIEALPGFMNAVVTIGTFDGVHEGHRKVIQQLIDEAKKINGESVIITFHPHPRKVVHSSILGLRLITTLDERIQLLRSLGVDHLVIIPFTEVFANQLPEAYLCDFLIERFKPHTIIIGYDHRFGRDRQGDYKLLEALQEKYRYRLQEIPKHVLDNISISSTKVREAILKGDITTANHLLGYTFFFEGEVVHGNKLGRELGYPTANLKIQDEEKIVPGNGVYAVCVKTAGREELLKGMMSIGLRPTVNGKTRTIEVNIFDFDEMIYGQTVRVYVKQFLREEVKFDSLEAMVKQIGHDKTNSLAVL